MPKGKVSIPSTIKRSPAKAQRTYVETLKSAEKEYGEGERASRTAYASLKHNFEKVGDHWEPKDEKGDSDPRSSKSTSEKQQGKGKTYGGVNVSGSTKQELYDKAKKLDVEGRSHMTKDQLGDAINKANQKKTAEARR